MKAPFDLRAVAVQGAGDDDLVAAAGFSLAIQVDAFLYAEASARGQKPPSAPMSRLQQNRCAALAKGSVHVRVQMKTHGEMRPAGAFDVVLAPEILPRRGKIQLPPVHNADAFPVSVMRRFQPLRALVLPPCAIHGVRPMQKNTVGAEFGGIGVVDRHRGMGRRGPQGGGPAVSLRPRRAAIDDQAVLADAHFKAESPCVARPGPGLGRPAAVHDDDRAPRRQPLETAMGRAGQRPAPDPGIGQHRVDIRPLLLDAAVEQGQASVAMAEPTQHRRHSVDTALQPRRRFDPGRHQQGPDLIEPGQQLKLTGGISLHMPAVGQNLSRKPLFQKSEGQIERGLPAGEANGSIDQPLDGVEIADVLRRPDATPGQVTGLNGGVLEQQGPGPVVLGGQERMEGQPGVKPLAENIGTPGKRVPFSVQPDPVPQERPRPVSRLVPAEGKQIGEPGKAVQGGKASRVLDGRFPGLRTKLDGAAPEAEPASQNSPAGLRVAPAQHGRGKTEGVRHPPFQGQPIKRIGVKQPPINFLPADGKRRGPRLPPGQ